MPEQRESTLERKIKRYVEEVMGGEFIKTQPPNKKGFPDRLIILPNGACIFMEIKRKGGVIEPLQDYWAKRLSNLGQYACIVDNLEDAKEFINAVNYEN